MDDFGAPMPAHTNSDDPLAQGNAAADRLSALGCAAPHLMTQFRPTAPASRLPVSAVPPSSRHRPRRRTEEPQVRGRSERPRPPQRDPRLPPFDPRQPASWLAFFRRLALFFRSITLPALCMIIMGTWWVTNYLSGCSARFPSTRSRDSPLGT